MKGSDNPAPSLLIVEGAAPASPAAGDQRLFIDSADHLLKRKNSGGTVTTIGSAALATDTLWDAAGDLVVGTGADTAAKLSVGADSTVLTVSPTTHVPVWSAPSGGGGGILGALSYSSGSDSIWKSFTSASWTDIDTTNAAMTITVPASGNVLFQLQVFYQNTVAANTFYLGIKTGSTMLGYALHVGSQDAPPNAGNLTDMHTVMIYCTGLTPGSLAVKAAARLGSASGNMNLYANDGSGGSGHVYPPFVMVAFAA